MSTTGAITSHIDVAQVVLYAFWIFFFGLIFYLRREDRREGYPLESDTAGVLKDPGVIWVPDPKTFVTDHYGTRRVPDDSRIDRRAVNATPLAVWPGAPSEPNGDPMKSGAGPASFAVRPDKPDLTLDGKPKIVPMRLDDEIYFEEGAPDPRGGAVVAADGRVAGTVRDLWVDKPEMIIRYLEVTLADGEGEARNVLLPMNFARVRRRWNSWETSVASIKAHHFADVPQTKNPDQVTFDEEERICAYYGGGCLYADPDRTEPYL